MVQSIRQLEDTGRQQYEQYKKEVLIDCSTKIQNTIKKNALPLFSTPIKRRTKESDKIELLKINAELMGKMLIALQSRDGDLPDFFSHEIQSFPPSLSDGDEIHLPPNKSHILFDFVAQDQHPFPAYDTKILDGAAVIHMLNRCC